MKIVQTNSTDGIIYKGLFSESSDPKGIIIHILGMSGSVLNEEYYSFMHNIYPKNGWSFLAGEHRGTGSITQFNNINDELVNIGNTFELFEDCVNDIQGWINYAKSLGYKKIWLQGHSLGTAKVAYFVSKTNEDVDGLILLSPSDMIGFVHDSAGITDHNKLLPEAKELVQQNKPAQILSGYLWGNLVLSAPSYLSFFGENAKDAIFNYGNPDLGWEVVNSLNVPVIAFTGTEDDGIATVLDVRQAMVMLDEQLVKVPRKKTVIFENSEHSFDGFGEKIVQEVLQFIG